MNGLTIGNIIDIVGKLTDSGMSVTEIRKIEVIIGDDEELNGVHQAYFAQLVKFEEERELSEEDEDEEEEFKAIFEECGIRTDISSLLIS